MGRKSLLSASLRVAPGLKGKGFQVTNFDIHKAYVRAALDAKRDCDELVDLLVDELRKQGPNQTVVLLQAVIEGRRPGAMGKDSTTTGTQDTTREA